MHKTELGRSIEQTVSQYLERQGLKLVEKNYFCRLGEVDLIMLDELSNTLIFVEVRFRANSSHGTATESVNRKKQIKLKRTVLHYLQKLGSATQKARVDVVGVSKSNHQQAGEQKSAASNPLELIDVSTIQVDEYQLVWTRNAITD